MLQEILTYFVIIVAVMVTFVSIIGLKASRKKSGGGCAHGSCSNCSFNKDVTACETIQQTKKQGA